MGGWGVASLAVVALSGCDYFWHIDHVDLDPDANGVVDGDASPPPLCSSTIVDDPFTTTTVTPCEPWGSRYSNASANLTAGSGRLRIDPTANGASAGCDTKNLVPFSDGGVIAHVTSAIGGDESYTSLQLNMTTDVTITINAGSLWFEDGLADNRWAEIPHPDPTAMIWLRLRPIRTGTRGIIAEYSSDSVNWLLLGFLAMTPPTNAIATIVAGVNQTAPSFSGMADFSEFIVCSQP